MSEIAYPPLLGERLEARSKTHLWVWAYGSRLNSSHIKTMIAVHLATQASHLRVKPLIKTRERIVFIRLEILSRRPIPLEQQL